MPLSSRETERYDRHLILPQVGREGQERLKASSVLCIGAGGLGSPTALYLAAAGVGRIGIVDADAVDLSNLQRQILHRESAVGSPKTESAAATLGALNSDVVVETHAVRLGSGNALALFREYDLIIDGSDNFPTRFLANDAAFLAGKPLVSGAIFRFEGQLTVFDRSENSPCYRCLLPAPPPPGMVPSCNEAGVLGALAGVVGTLQSMEALKLILRVGDPLVGRMLVYDSLAPNFRTLKLPRDPQCPLCGANPEITQLVNYEQACSAPPSEEIAIGELRDLIESGTAPEILDVRTPEEYSRAHLPHSRLAPLQVFDEILPTLSPDQPYLVFCHVGQRSAYACELLREAGFDQVRNVTGGLMAWQREHGTDLLEAGPPMTV